MSELAVVVTCHEPYLRWLPQALDSIDRQVPSPRERVVVFDRCAPPASIDPEWRCVFGEWGHPSGGRNAGLQATTAPWVVFLDADNIVRDGYLAAMEQAIGEVATNVGIIYPDIQYCDEALQPKWLYSVPTWDYWQLRAQNFVDTSSAWRRDALEVVGEWPLGIWHEDYALALVVTAAGWAACRLDAPPVLKRGHPEARHNELIRQGGLLTAMWSVRSLGIVSLLAGRAAILAQWSHFLQAAELPPATSLYVLDNSGDLEFSRRAFDTTMEISERRALKHVDFARIGQAYRPAPLEPYLVKSRSLHVTRLYAEVLPRVTEDLVLTLEDDVEPPPHAIRRLGEALVGSSEGDVGAVASPYASPRQPDLVVAGRGLGRWGRQVAWEELPPEPLDVTCVGGGCTVWANWAIHDCAVHMEWGPQGKLGWDGALCWHVREKGYRVLLHGGVRSQHHVHGKLGGNLTEQDLPVFTVSPRPAPPVSSALSRVK